MWLGAQAEGSSVGKSSVEFGEGGGGQRRLEGEGPSFEGYGKPDTNYYKDLHVRNYMYITYLILQWNSRKSLWETPTFR
jgi:hypothetical protein